MKCDTIAERHRRGGARDVTLDGAAGRADEGHQRGLGRKILADSGLPIITAEQHGRAAQKVVAAVAEGQLRNEHVDPDQQEHQGHHAGDHRQDRPVPHADVPRLRQRQELLRRRRQPEEGRRGLRGHPDLRDGEGGEGGHRRHGQRDLRAAAVRRRGDRRGGRRRPRPRRLHHRGHPGARHDPHALPDAGQEDAAARPQLPRRHHARRDQDRHHAGPHPQEGPHRRRSRARAR